MEKTSAIVEKAADYVTALFKKELSDNHLYHTLNHTIDVVEGAEEIAEGSDVPDDQQEILMLAAWFHDTGYLKAYRGHEDYSKQYAQQFLAGEDYPSEKIGRILELIDATKSGREPENLLEEIIHDADHINIGKKSFFRKAELLRLEWEIFLEKVYTNSEWNELQQQYLLNTSFYTKYAKNERGKRREKNIIKQQKNHTKAVAKHKKNKAPKRGTETMYRTTYRNHINLSSIADSKANMMISINTIIMSVIITVVGGGFSLTEKAFIENLRFVIPICILLIGALISVIFAVLSARPSVTEKKVNLEKIKKKKSSALFFGNFAYMELKDFLKSMRTLTNSKDLLYDNMTIDIYYLGQVLTKKYRLLRYSYNIFMIGLVIAVVAFIGIFVYTQTYGQIELPQN